MSTINKDFDKIFSLKNQGKDLFNTKKYVEAAAKYSEALKMCRSEDDPIKKMILSNTANCYRRLKKYTEAIEMFDESLKIDSEYAFARNGKAKTLMRIGNSLYVDEEKYPEAAEKFQEAIEICTNSDQKIYLTNLGKCHIKLKDYSKAIEIFDKALKIDSEYSDAKYAKALALNSHGDTLQYDEEKYCAAAEKYLEAIELCTTSDEKKLYLTNLGMCYKNSKEYFKAIDMFDKALEIDSEYMYAVNGKYSAMNPS